MSRLAALKKQIAALEAQAERIAKEEAASAIARIKDIMAEFNLSIEHLAHAIGGRRAARKTRAKPASVAKYADPKTGKTWSGVGRAPAWIAGAKNRDAFLVAPGAIGKAGAKVPAAGKETATKPARAAKVARKAAKPGASKGAARAGKVSGTKPASAVKNKPAAKAAAKKSAPKQAAAAAVAPAVESAA